jgi:hypothetical protein
MIELKVPYLIFQLSGLSVTLIMLQTRLILNTVCVKELNIFVCFYLIQIREQNLKIWNKTLANKLL